MVWTLFEIWLLDHWGTLSLGEYVQPVKRVRYDNLISLINVRVQSPHVRINLNINKGRLKTIWWLWELELGGIHHGLPHEVLHVR